MAVPSVLIGLVAGAIAVVVAGAAVFIWSRSHKSFAKEPDYRAIFVLGICFLPLGIPLSIAVKNPGLLGISALGVVYVIIGLQNRDKWKKG